MSTKEKSGSKVKPFVDVIWNMTRVCPWNCADCCVDADHVKMKSGYIEIRSNSLKNLTKYKREASFKTHFDQAAAIEQKNGRELDFAGKLRILDNLRDVNPKIDFSGGDPLVLSDTLKIIRLASEKFGKKNITLTATGPGLSQIEAGELKTIIGELNFTYNGEPDPRDPNRPSAYARSNLRQAKILTKAGIKTRAECPLTIQNIENRQLEKIFLELNAAGIRDLLIMREFPVGRGETRIHQIPSPREYIYAITFLRKLESMYGYPKIKLQCALKHLDSYRISDENPCDAGQTSFGLMADGTLLISPWAVNKSGNPIDPNWIIGNLSQQPMIDLLNSLRVKTLRKRMNQNWGHCKIFSFLYGESESPWDRMFEPKDPLYENSVAVAFTKLSK